MNLGSYGDSLVYHTPIDLSGASTLTFELWRPDGTTMTVVGQLGTTPITRPGNITWAANTWAYYTFQEGDLDQSGTWYARLIYEDAEHLRNGTSIPFVIGP